MEKTLTLLTVFIILATFSQITYGEEKRKSITIAEANAIVTKAIPGEIVKAEGWKYHEKGNHTIGIKTNIGTVIMIAATMETKTEIAIKNTAVVGHR